MLGDATDTETNCKKSTCAEPIRQLGEDIGYLNSVIGQKSHKIEQLREEVRDLEYIIEKRGHENINQHELIESMRHSIVAKDEELRKQNIYIDLCDEQLVKLSNSRQEIQHDFETERLAKHEESTQLNGEIKELKSTNDQLLRRISELEDELGKNGYDPLKCTRETRAQLEEVASTISECGQTMSDTQSLGAEILDGPNTDPYMGGSLADELALATQEPDANLLGALHTYAMENTRISVKVRVAKPIVRLEKESAYIMFVEGERGLHVKVAIYESYTKFNNQIRPGDHVLLQNFRVPFDEFKIPYMENDNNSVVRTVRYDIAPL